MRGYNQPGQLRTAFHDVVVATYLYQQTYLDRLNEHPAAVADRLRAYADTLGVE